MFTKTFPRLKDVKNFIEGNFNHYLDKFNLLEPHIKEQFWYRFNKSNPTCINEGRCIDCGCAVPKMFFSSSKSCNFCGWGPMLTEEEWEIQKRTLQEEIKEINDD